MFDWFSNNADGVIIHIKRLIDNAKICEFDFRGEVFPIQSFVVMFVDKNIILKRYYRGNQST
jgi:hypothetical protein